MQQEDYLRPEEYNFITEFSVKQNNNCVHSIDIDSFETVNFQIRLGLFQPLYSEGHQKLQIDISPSHWRSETLRQTHPGEGRQAVIPYNQRGFFIFEAGFSLDAQKLRDALSSHFDVRVYLLTENMNDGSYITRRIFRTILPFGKDAELLHEE
ncbi:hypothetical protein [Lacticaseibacillus sp. N501-2]|uniref:hypothetical protein n=1 Tax=Lacticaseibacillus salsurae TaxID=3367729 RepID=UPI0038B3012F